MKSLVKKDKVWIKKFLTKYTISPDESYIFWQVFVDIGIGGRRRIIEKDAIHKKYECVLILIVFVS